MSPLARLLATYTFIAPPCVFVAIQEAHAAEADVYCQTGTSSTGAPIFVPASTLAPCPVSATFSGTVVATTSATAAAIPPVVSPGTGKALVIDLNSGLYVQPSISGVPVDGTHPMPVSGTLVASGTQTVAGTVAVSGTIPVSGTIGVSGTVPVSGTITSTPSGTTTVAGTIGVSGTIPVSGTVTSTGTVAVSGTIPVSGTVTSTPSGTTTVAGTVAVSGTIPVSGTVAVGGTSVVSGTISAAQSGNFLVQGVTASGAAVAGNPLLTGARAASTVPTAVADGQAVAFMASLEGKLINVPFAPKEFMLRGSAVATGTTAVSVIAAVTGLKTYITGAQCYRTDAGTVTADVTLSDSLATALVLPAGGGSNVQFGTPLVTSTTSAAVTMTPSAALTSVKCMLQGYSGAFLLDGDLPDLNHGYTGAFLVASEESDFVVAG